MKLEVYEEALEAFDSVLEVYPEMKEFSTTVPSLSQNCNVLRRQHRHFQSCRIGSCRRCPVPAGMLAC